MDRKSKKFKSDYIYIDGEVWKEKWTDVKSPSITDSKFLASNGFFTAIPWKAMGGGQLAVMRSNDFCKFGANDYMLKGHTAPIIAFEFNPFIDNLLATASEDGTLGLWTIPPEGLTEDLKTPNAMMFGHSKKLTHLTFNPTAENVIATTSYDKEVRIWDAYRAKEAMCLEELIGQPTCLEWNYDGSMLGITDKKKSLHIVDPRQEASAMLAKTCHTGPKPVKTCWLAETNRLVTTGLSKGMLRELAVWDSRDMSEPIVRKQIDKNIEVSDPFYDRINKLIYCAVKGEGRVHIWEVADDSEVIHFINSWKGEGSHRGFTFVPKRFVEVTNSELMRAVRLTEKNCEFVSFRLPKKKGAFVASLYGPCEDGNASVSHKQWREGEAAPPGLIKMDRDLLDTLCMRATEGGAPPEDEPEEEYKAVPQQEKVAPVTMTPVPAPVPAQVPAPVPDSKPDQVDQAQIPPPIGAPAPPSEDTSALQAENESLRSKINDLEDRIKQLEAEAARKDREHAAELEKVKQTYSLVKPSGK